MMSGSELRLHSNDDVQLEDQLLFLQEHKKSTKLLQSFMEQLEQHPQIDSYLQKIQLSSSTLMGELKKVQNKHYLLVQLYQRTSIVGTVYRNLKTANQWLQTVKMEELDAKGKAVWLLQVQAKVGCVYQHFAMNFRKDINITNSPKLNYHQVWEKIKVVKPRDEEGLKKALAKLKEQLHALVASVLTQEEHECGLNKKLMFSLSLMKGFVMSDSAKLYSMPFYRQPRLQSFQSLISFAEQGLMKKVRQVSFAGVQTNRMLYLPANCDKMTNEEIKQWDVFKEVEGQIQLRVISAEQLVFYEGGKKGKQSGCCGGSEQEPKQWQTVLIYIHGGGFMGSSSHTAQIFTRVWANRLNVPILCIDYRIPPEHVFPQPVYDCYNSYQFIVDHIHKYVNIRPKTIYMAGQSAGGNLCCGVTALLMRDKLPTPEGLFLNYPLLDTRLSPSESYVNSYTDLLLWPSIVLMIMRIYLQNDLSRAQDPLASPVLLTEEFVSGTAGDMRFPLRWPRSVLTIGSMDPIHDGVLLMMERMVESKVDCECTIYEGLSHGYYGIAKVVEEGEKPHEQSVRQLKRLMMIY